MSITKSDLNNMDERYRAKLINSVSGYKSANLIGSIDDAGQTNLAVVSSVVHLGANPPLLGVVFRPHSVSRHTLENILTTERYTINHINQHITEQAHQTSARYAKEQSEFDATGLSEEFIDDFSAPFVKESVIKLAMHYKAHQTLALNGTVFVIGEIMALHLPPELIGDDGHVDLVAAGSVCINGLDGYYNPSLIARYPYAKP
ncbi:flavin reductase family protein [Pseudoalteromonas fenneropenaei]|uniref:Flavin reductase family protein n=1 Tax=Pseudoalteromonas fenneropenaei TaxID=1737459 RepID=A0ABV7CF88_9GAMM